MGETITTYPCVHGRRQNRCRDCGKGYCIHGRDKYCCRDCGVGYCQHGNVKARCRYCLGIYPKGGIQRQPISWRKHAQRMFPREEGFWYQENATSLNDSDNDDSPVDPVRCDNDDDLEPVSELPLPILPQLCRPPPVTIQCQHHTHHHMTCETCAMALLL